METAGISQLLLSQLQAEVSSNPQLQLAQAATARHDPHDVCMNRALLADRQHVFDLKVTHEGKPISNQRSSGRCWLFAAANVMRQPLMRLLNVEEVELSQNYLFFYDKLERANYMLDAYVETARRGEAADGRLVAHLLGSPLDDGGQWDMIVNVVLKHGIVPRQVFPDTWSAENSRRMCAHLNTKMREACAALRAEVEKGADTEPVKQQYLGQIYRILSVCLGTPPTSFTWEYTTKDSGAQRIGPISPLEFYEQFVKPDTNLENMISLIHDPRPENPTGRCYTVEFLGNTSGGRPTLHLNVSMQQLKELVLQSLRKNQAVWYGCDVGKYFNRKHALEDLDLHQHELLYGCSFRNLDKAQRLVYRDSLMTHAMLITGAGLDNEGAAYKYRVENSWGADDGDGAKGYLLMTDQWFSEFVYQVVVDRSLVPTDLLEAREMPPTVLPAWDPMGSLA